MATELLHPQLSMLYSRLLRMRQSGNELLLASGLDELLPLLDCTLAVLPQLDRVARDLSNAAGMLQATHDLLASAGEQRVAATDVCTLLSVPSAALRQQAERVTGLLSTPTLH